MNKAKLAIPEKQIKEFCKKWNVKELSLFGSALTDNFNKDSDIDILVTFGEDSHHTLFDLVHMETELEKLFGCDVDLVSKRGLEQSRNSIRRDAILNSAELLYAA
jgi:uncharacterized protein